MKVFKIWCLTFLAITSFSIGSKAEPPEVVKFLSDYVQIPSITGHEEEAALWLENYADSAGFHTKMLHDDSASFNLAASLYPLDSDKPNVVFFNHIDVVKEGEQDLWKYPPWSGAIEEGQVWGRGAIDNKGMAAMQLFAMLEFLDEEGNPGLPFNVTLLAVSNEEMGGELGAKRVVEDYLDKLDPVVVLGEGGTGLPGLIGRYPEKTGYGVSIAQKTRVELKLKAELESAGHGSVPPDRYSNKVLVEALHEILERRQSIEITPPVEVMFHELGRQEGGIRGFFLRNITALRPFLGSTFKDDELLRSLVLNSVTITDISNPETAGNQVPQWAHATLDCRLLPGTSSEDFIEEIEDLVDDKDVEIELVRQRTPANFTPPDQYYQILKEAILDVDPNGIVIPILFPASNDNSYFRAQNIPVYGILPGRLSMEQMRSIHNVNERIDIDEVVEGTEAYKAFLRKLEENPPEKMGDFNP